MNGDEPRTPEIAKEARGEIEKMAETAYQEEMNDGIARNKKR